MHTHTDRQSHTHTHTQVPWQPVRHAHTVHALAFPVDPGNPYGLPYVLLMLMFPIICVAFKVPRIHQTHATTHPAPKTGETPETCAFRYVYDVDPSRDLAKQVDKIRWKIVNGYRAAARAKAGYHGDGACGPEDGHRGKERTKRRCALGARNEIYADVLAFFDCRM